MSDRLGYPQPMKTTIDVSRLVAREAADVLGTATAQGNSERSAQGRAQRTAGAGSPRRSAPGELPVPNPKGGRASVRPIACEGARLAARDVTLVVADTSSLGAALSGGGRGRSAETVEDNRLAILIPLTLRASALGSPGPTTSPGSPAHIGASARSLDAQTCSGGRSSCEALLVHARWTPQKRLHQSIFSLPRRPRVLVPKSGIAIATSSSSLG